MLRESHASAGLAERKSLMISNPPRSAVCDAFSSRMNNAGYQRRSFFPPVIKESRRENQVDCVEYRPLLLATHLRTGQDAGRFATTKPKRNRLTLPLGAGIPKENMKD